MWLSIRFIWAYPVGNRDYSAPSHNIFPFLLWRSICIQSIMKATKNRRTKEDEGGNPYYRNWAFYRSFLFRKDGKPSNYEIDAEHAIYNYWRLYILNQPKRHCSGRRTKIIHVLCTTNISIHKCCVG